MWHFLSNGRWTKKWNCPWLVTNNEYNKVKATAKCLQMKKNMTSSESYREVVQKTECRCLTCAPPQPGHCLSSPRQISQSRSSPKCGSFKRTWFLFCSQVVLLLHEMQTGFVCISTNVSSFKGIRTYCHACWIKYPGLYKQGHNEFWAGVRSTPLAKQIHASPRFPAISVDLHGLQATFYPDGPPSPKAQVLERL